jgi:hypothetical protein
MEEDVDDVHEIEKLVSQEDLESKSSKLILANYMNKIEEESREKKRIADKKYKEKKKKPIAEKKYEDNQKQLKIEQNKQRIEQNKQRIEQNKQRKLNAQKQKREREQKHKREDAINKKRNDLKPFRSSLECRWNQECKWGCGYIHLDRATPSMKSNCCMNGKLSPLQANQFYEIWTFATFITWNARSSD